MHETIWIFNLKIGLNEEQYSRLKDRTEINGTESIEREAENIIKSIL